MQHITNHNLYHITIHYCSDPAFKDAIILVSNRSCDFALLVRGKKKEHEKLDFIWFHKKCRYSICNGHTSICRYSICNGYAMSIFISLKCITQPWWRYVLGVRLQIWSNIHHVDFIACPENSNSHKVIQLDLMYWIMNLWCIYNISYNIFVYNPFMIYNIILNRWIQMGFFLDLGIW